MWAVLSNRFTLSLTPFLSSQMTSRGARIRDLALAMSSLDSEDSENRTFEEALLHDIIVQPDPFQDPTLLTYSEDHTKYDQYENIAELDILPNGHMVRLDEVREGDVHYDTLLEPDTFQETECNQEAEECDSNNLLANRVKLVEYSDSDDCSDAIDSNSMDYAKQYQQNKGADEECSKKTVVSNVELKADDTDTSDSGSEVEFGDSNNLKGKRLKKIQPKSHIQKKLRESGKKYLNYRNQEIPEKRVLANPCNENCVNACNTFTELERNQIFTLFWSLGSNIEKRSFINGCVNIVPVKGSERQLKILGEI
nr:unnamed protein product [Callosobruchus analis]